MHGTLPSTDCPLKGTSPYSTEQPTFLHKAQRKLPHGRVEVLPLSPRTATGPMNKFPHGRVE